MIASPPAHYQRYSSCFCQQTHNGAHRENNRVTRMQHPLFGRPDYKMGYGIPINLPDQQAIVQILCSFAIFGLQAVALRRPGNTCTNFVKFFLPAIAPDAEASRRIKAKSSEISRHGIPQPSWVSGEIRTTSRLGFTLLFPSQWSLKPIGAGILQQIKPEADFFDWAGLVLFEVFETERPSDEILHYKADVFTNFPNGDLEGFRAARVESCKGFTLFGRPLTLAYVHPSEVQGPYRVTIAIVPFEHEIAVRQSAHDLSIDTEAEINLLRLHLLNSKSHAQSEAIGSISVFRASKTLVTGFEASAISDWKRKLGLEDQVSISCTFQDAAILPGLFSNARRMDYTVVFPALPSEIEGTKGNLVVSRTLYRLIDLLSRNRMVRASCERVSGLPLAKFEPTQYVYEITSGRVDVLRAYLTQHLKDREQTVAELLDTELRLARLVAMDQSVLSSENWNSVEVPSSGRRGIELKDEFAPKLLQSVNSLREQLLLVNRRMSMTMEHIRDLLTANVADSNLRLQRTLFWIALGALGIALIGLLIGLMTDDVKKQFIGSILNLLSQLTRK